VELKDVQRFAELAGLKHITPDEDRGWVRASCPFASTKHPKGTDSKPSFGIHLPKDGKPPYFNCFTCGSGGSLKGLLSHLLFQNGEVPVEATKFLMQFPEAFHEEDLNGEHTSKRIRVDKYLDIYEQEKTVVLPVPQKILEQYPLVFETESRAAEEIKFYLQGRKITEEVAKKYRLRVFSDRYGQAGVIFPIISKNGVDVLDVQVRMINSPRRFWLTPKITGSPTYYKASSAWFGQQFHTPDIKNVFLVEGGEDALRLASLIDPNVIAPLASMGQPSKEQLDGLYAKNVIIAFDADVPGREMAVKAINSLTVPFLGVLYWDVVGKKDAGDIESKEELMRVWSKMQHINRALLKK